MLFFLIIALIRITFHTFLSPLYNSSPHRGPGCLTDLPFSSLTSPCYVCSYIAPLPILLSLAGFCLSCFHFSLAFSIHLDHQTSWVSRFPILLMMMILSIQFLHSSQTFPTNSLLPPSNSFLPTMLALQLCQLIPEIWHSQAVFSDVWEYIPEKVSARARASNQCTTLKLFLSGELLGNHHQA